MKEEFSEEKTEIWLTFEEAAKLFFKDRPKKFSEIERRPVTGNSFAKILSKNNLSGRSRRKNFKTIDGFRHVSFDKNTGANSEFTKEYMQSLIYQYYDLKNGLENNKQSGGKVPRRPRLDELEASMK